MLQVVFLVLLNIQVIQQQTVAHGLGAAPKWILVKKESAGGDNWQVYHVGVGNDTAMQLDNNGGTSGAQIDFMTQHQFS